MKESYYRKLLGKYVIIHWKDPKSQHRVIPKEFVEEGFADIHTNGRFKGYDLKRKMLLLSHECITDDAEEDLTMIHSDLVYKIEIIKN